MREIELGKIVVDCGYRVHQKLGPGLFEAVYEVVLTHELKKRGLAVDRQVSIPIRYDNVIFDEGFRADIVVENLVIIEVKSVEKEHPVFRKQLLTYLRLSEKKLGYVINFGQELFKDGVCRVSNGAPNWNEDDPK